MQACFPLLTHPTSVILLLAEMWNPSQLSQQLRVLTEEEMEKIAKEEQLWVFKHSFNLFRMPIAKDPWFLAVTSLNMFSLICSMMWHFSGRQHVHTHQITLRLPNIHWYPSSQVHKNFQFFSSYSDCKTYLATLWKQILSLRTGFEWNKRIGQWTTSPWSAGDRTSCSAWRFVFNISLWDWHASHRIRVLYVSSNRLDCHYLKSFFFFFFPIWLVLLKFFISQHLSSVLSCSSPVRLLHSHCLWFCYGSLYCCHAESDNLNFLLST